MSSPVILRPSIYSKKEKAWGRPHLPQVSNECLETRATLNSLFPFIDSPRPFSLNRRRVTLFCLTPSMAHPGDHAHHIRFKYLKFASLNFFFFSDILRRYRRLQWREWALSFWVFSAWKRSSCVPVFCCTSLYKQRLTLSSCIVLNLPKCLDSLLKGAGVFEWGSTERPQDTVIYLCLYWWVEWILITML